MEKTMGRQVRSGDWVKTLVLTAVVAAMACAATLAVQIPSPTGGYLNLGDAVVLLGAYLLGPGWGAAAGAVGPALADLMTYPTYVPATLLIKAVMGFAAGTLYSRLRTRGWGALVCGIVGEIPMVVATGSMTPFWWAAWQAAPPGFPPIWSRPCSAWQCPPCWLRHCAAAAMCAGSFPGCET